MCELASQTAVTKELKDISNKATQVPLDMEMHFQERNHDVSKCEALNLKSWEEEGEDTELDLSMESGLHDRKPQNFTALGPALPSQKPCAEISWTHFCFCRSRKETRCPWIHFCHAFEMGCVLKC